MRGKVALVAILGEAFDRQAVLGAPALAELARRGHRVVDTDYGAYSEEVRCSEAGGWEHLWREDRIDALLDGNDGGIAGSNRTHRERGCALHRESARRRRRLRRQDQPA